MHIEKHITRLRNLLLAEGQICFIWSFEDVQEVRPDLTKEQCIEVLKQCERRHDATIGINWEVLRIHADGMFPDEQPSNNAPELLAALQGILQDDMNGMTEQDIAAIEPDSIYGRALAAIAAAKGGC